MTWIKPSFLWLMERSNWGTKADQQRILGVRITRAGWDKALSKAILTSFEPSVHGSIDAWRAAFADAAVHVQWDPERSLSGAKLDHRAIQAGLSRSIIEEYVTEWIVEIEDLTPLAHKIRRLRDEGHSTQAKRLLPPEKRYEVDAAIASRLAMNAS